MITKLYILINEKVSDGLLRWFGVLDIVFKGPEVALIQRIYNLQMVGARRRAKP